MLRQVAVVARALHATRFPLANPWTQVLVGVAAALGGAVVRFLLSDPLGGSLPFATFFPAVAVGAWAGGLRGGVAATVTGAVLAMYFVLAPPLSLAVEDVVGLGLFLVGSTLIVALGGQLHAIRAAAEIGRDRAAFLSDASAILNEQLDPIATLDSLSRAAVPRFADWCVIDLFERDGTWSDARIAAIEPGVVEIAHRIRREYPYQPGDATGVPAVFRTGAPEFMLDVPDGFMDVIQDRTLRGLMEGLRIRSFISVPLASSAAHRLGVLTVVQSSSGRRFTQEDVGTAVDLGRRAGTALEHARLYRDTKRLSDELDAVIRSLTDPVLLARADGSIVRSNAAASRALGDVDGANLDAVFADLAPVPGRPAVRRTTAGVYVTPVELEPAAAGSESRIAILRDVSDLIRTEAARDAFVGMLSHELRTPITTIYGVAQVLRKMLAAERQAGSGPELLTDLALETERLHRLVEDLLVLSRFERGRLEMSMEPVLVNRVVQGAARRVADLSPRLDLQIRTDVALPPVSADPTYLEQVLRNLVSNAVKYAGEDARVRIDVTSNDAVVRLVVDDDGPGIAEADRARIFELYERLNEAVSQPGSGIGLFVCKRLIESMGGTIAAGRADSGGARFTIELPVLAQDVPLEPEGEPPAQQLVGAGEA